MVYMREIAEFFVSLFRDPQTLYFGYTSPWLLTSPVPRTSRSRSIRPILVSNKHSFTAMARFWVHRRIVGISEPGHVLCPQFSGFSSLCKRSHGANRRAECDLVCSSTHASLSQLRHCKTWAWCFCACLRIRCCIRGEIFEHQQISAWPRCVWGVYANIRSMA